MRVILCGLGRMGREIVQCAKECGAEICCGIDRAAIPKDELPFPLYKSAEEADFGKGEVFVDFAYAEGIAGRAALCAKRKIPLVVGTTNLKEEDWAALKRAAKEIPLVQSNNFSPAVLLLKELVKRAAGALEGFDICIEERHRREKRDSPSGTALMLKEAAEKAQATGEEIQICSLRLGDSVGEHSVLFAGKGEELSLSHSARERAIFARGALCCAHWLTTQKPGIYPAEAALFRQKAFFLPRKPT